MSAKMLNLEIGEIDGREIKSFNRMLWRYRTFMSFKNLHISIFSLLKGSKSEVEKLASSLF